MDINIDWTEDWEEKEPRDLKTECKEVLSNYNWEYNTEKTRDNIMKSVSEICEEYKADDVIYEYKVICDETNNTPDAIDNRLGVVDIYTKENKDSDIVVYNITTSIPRLYGITEDDGCRPMSATNG